MIEDENGRQPCISRESIGSGWMKAIGYDDAGPILSEN